MNSGRRLRVDPKSMEGAGRGLAQATAGLDEALSKLRADLAAQGSPWGEDEVGRRFSGDYLEMVQKAFHAIGSYRDQIDYAATQLPSEGKRFGSTEQDNTREITNVWPVPPPDQR